MLVHVNTAQCRLSSHMQHPPRRDNLHQAASAGGVNHKLAYLILIVHYSQIRTIFATTCGRVYRTHQQQKNYNYLRDTLYLDGEHLLTVFKLRDLNLRGGKLVLAR